MMNGRRRSAPSPAPTTSGAATVRQNPASRPVPTDAVEVPGGQRRRRRVPGGLEAVGASARHPARRLRPCGRSRGPSASASAVHQQLDDLSGRRSLVSTTTASSAPGQGRVGPGRVGPVPALDVRGDGVEVAASSAARRAARTSGRRRQEHLERASGKTTVPMSRPSTTPPPAPLDPRPLAVAAARPAPPAWPRRPRRGGHLRAPDGGGHVGAVHPHRAGVQLEARAAGPGRPPPARWPAIGRASTSPARSAGPGHGPVHGPGVEVGHAEALGQRPGDRRLAGAGRPVERDTSTVRSAARPPHGRAGRPDRPADEVVHEARVGGGDGVHARHHGLTGRRPGRPPPWPWRCGGRRGSPRAAPRRTGRPRARPARRPPTSTPRRAAQLAGDRGQPVGLLDPQLAGAPEAGRRPRPARRPRPGPGPRRPGRGSPPAPRRCRAAPAAPHPDPTGGPVDLEVGPHPRQHVEEAGPGRSQVEALDGQVGAGHGGRGRTARTRPGRGRPARSHSWGSSMRGPQAHHGLLGVDLHVGAGLRPASPRCGPGCGPAPARRSRPSAPEPGQQHGRLHLGRGHRRGEVDAVQRPAPNHQGGEAAAVPPVDGRRPSAAAARRPGPSAGGAPRRRRPAR